MLTIYTQHITARLSYVIETLFEDFIGVSVLITQDKERLDLKAPCFNYSHEVIEGVPFLRPHSLLFEEGMRVIAEKMDSHGILFPCESDVAGHDLLAASFFLLSRYEEYTDSEVDQHGRKMAKNSQMYRAGLLSRPLVDEWAFTLYGRLQKIYPELPAPDRNFTMLPTFDVDVAYAYLGRGLARRWKSTLKDLSKLETSRLKERSAVLKGSQKDPYDSYPFQKDSCQSRGLESRHFFLLGDRGPVDHNLPHSSEAIRSLIQEIDRWSKIGIHPSMGSNESEPKLKKEIKRLKTISGSKVERSRQHFLYLDLPETYQRLIRQGITEDYSMGYADHVGFRAGTCSIFRWFDLSSNEATPLYLIPICAMDSTLKDYMGLEPDEAIELLRDLIQSVKSVRGLFVPLWHNHSVAEVEDWKGWKEVYLASIEPS